MPPAREARWRLFILVALVLLLAAEAVAIFTA